MNPESGVISTKVIWSGRILSALVALLMVSSAVMKFVKPAPVAQGMVHLGIPEGLILGLGILELACTVIYVIPRTAVLGAILLTGYLGGATAILARVGDPFVMPVIVGVLVWGGLFLRDKRISQVLDISMPRS